MADIQINELLESTTAANSDWIAIDNGSATKKISVRNFNATGAASAAQSAAAAAQSASAALAAQTAAEQAEDDAQALITSAQTIVSDAQTYANEASTSAGTASTAANTATAQAAIATQAATQAGTYAQNVDSFAKTAKSWAVGGTGTRSGEDTDNSKYYSQQAHTFEINAATSETNAAASEANAAISETNAAASESNAAASALRAAQSESNASTSATNAALSASSALNSANNAATSETNAASSETNADLSKDDSEAWAWGKVDGVDVPPSHPAYHNNAKYYADQASGGVSGVSSFNARTGNVVPALGDYAANIVAFDNTGSSLQSTTTQDAIEEVQDNVDDVASDLSTLDASLKPVAKSGAYNDLTGLPTLATVATSGSYNDLSNKPTLGTAAAKDSTNAVTSGSTDLLESGAAYSELALKASSEKAYQTDDTIETTLASDDIIPFYDTSATAKRKMTVQKFGEQLISNPNLLDNPWFTVNQRGQSRYVGDIYGVDRWKSFYSTSIVDVYSDGIAISTSEGVPNFIFQRHDDLTNLSGKVVTISCLKGSSNRAVLQLRKNGAYDSGYSFAGSADYISWTVRMPTLTSSDTIDICLEANDKIHAIKLELGSVSTLAMDTAPKYAEELLKCQRYFWRKTIGSGIPFGCGFAISTTQARFGIVLPTIMRSTPTLTANITTALDIIQSGAVHTSSAVSVDAMRENDNVISILVTTTGLTNNEICIGKAGSDVTYLNFSADL